MAGVPVAIASLLLFSACDESGVLSPSSSGFEPIGPTADVHGPDEHLYLTDSGSQEPDGLGTDLFRVDLDDVEEEANLTLLAHLDAPDYDQVDAIAASADGATVWAVDKISSHLGAYDVAAETFTDLGEITGLPAGVVLAATSPSDELWVANQNNNNVYTINTASTPPSASLVGTMSGATFLGADFVFDAAGDLFFWTNFEATDLRGFYSLDQGSLAANYIGPEPGEDVTWFVTGLAIRDVGEGDIVGSTNEDEVRVIDATTGATTANYAMMFEGAPYAYEFGDMTVGNIIPEEEGDEGCTLGFWGNRALMIDAWDETAYSTDQTLEDVFDVPNSYGLDDVTLLEALGLTGGPAVADKAALLLKQAVPAILNASHPDVEYPASEATIIADVNAALASMDAETIEELKDQLDGWNNLGSDLCGEGEDEEDEGGPPSGVPGKGKGKS